MNKTSFVFLFFIIFWGCFCNADSNLKSSQKDLTTMDNKTIDGISKDSILVDFINNISNQKYEKAFSLIHPKLKDAWTNKGFEQDWEEIRSTVEKWAPEVISTLKGTSQQGPFEQVIYKLDSKWNSLSSVDLVSMKVDGREYLVKLHIRAPYPPYPYITEAPKSVREAGDKFIQLMFNNQYQEISNLMTQNCKQQFPAETIKQLKPILGKNKSELEKQYYRICANTVWYDAIRFNIQGDAFTFLELILTTKNQRTEIVNLTFRGAMSEKKL